MRKKGEHTDEGTHYGRGPILRGLWRGVTGTSAKGQ